MLIKRIKNWKELNEEEKKETRQMIKDAGLILLGGGAAMLGYHVGQKIFDVRYPSRRLQTEWYEGTDAFIIRLCASNKSGTKSVPIGGVLYSLADAKDDLKMIGEELAKATASVGESQFNSAIEAATEAING